jgi:hypothetical protein
MSSFVAVYEIFSAEEFATGVQLGGARWGSQPQLSRRSQENFFGPFPATAFLTHSETEECGPHYLFLRATPLAYAKET